MRTARRHAERHRTDHIGWLRAAVLGANDGIVSTASLVVGVAAAGGAAGADSHALLLTGFAGLVAGAMSMAAGEYVSVHSQADTEAADLAKERMELATDAPAEQRELAAIYLGRGLTPELASQVATQLMAHDALGAHARDELGISDTLAAKPVQAALASAASFAVGAALPLVMTALAPVLVPALVSALVPALMPASATGAGLITWVAGSSLLFLAALGVAAARVGGAPVLAGAVRVTLWGALAMGITAAAGVLFGAVA